MESVHAIVNGNRIKFLEPVPVEGTYEVTVIFNKPVVEDAKTIAKKKKATDAEIEAKIKRMESCFGIFNDEDMNVMKEIIADRKNFFKGREKYDIP